MMVLGYRGTQQMITELKNNNNTLKKLFSIFEGWFKILYSQLNYLFLVFCIFWLLPTITYEKVVLKIGYRNLSVGQSNQVSR